MKRRTRGSLLYTVTLLVLTTLSTTTGRAGTTVTGTPATVATQETSKPQLQPLADGTKNPGLIPDEVALRILFLTTSVSANPTAAETRGQQAKLGRMNLGQADMTVLLQRLRVVDGLATAQKARLSEAREAVKRNPTPAAVADLVGADGQLDTLLADTYSALRQSLSPEGAAKLQEHVAYTKTKIKILPPPKMTAPHH